jgi:hypothetical protein
MGFTRKIAFNILLSSLSYSKLLFTALVSCSLQERFPNGTGISRQKQEMNRLLQFKSEVRKLNQRTYGEKRQAARDVKFTARTGSENW